MQFSYLSLLLGNTTVDELMMRLMAAMEIFSAQQQEDIKDEVRAECWASLQTPSGVWVKGLSRQEKETVGDAIPSNRGRQLVPIQSQSGDLSSGQKERLVGVLTLGADGGWRYFALKFQNDMGKNQYSVLWLVVSQGL